ncbi:MAG: serine/threonine protein kinase [Myxococcota bacterium]
MVKRAAGPFEILEILGEGSFGTVCIARVAGDPQRREVERKFLKGAYTRNPKILNRTRDEARLLSTISHPNVVRVERMIEIGGRPVIVMELVEGVSLDQLLLRFKQGIPAGVAIEVVRQTLIALHVAYYEANGPDGRPLKVIHRDIKPSNILLSVTGDLKVVDFGIAKGDFSGREAETESVVLGSRPYMAPERLDGVSDSPTVDVYSSGMSLFELLTGRTMSLSINPVTHEQAMNRQLGYLSVEGMTEGGLDDLRGIVRRMCSYERDYRPSALEAARELEQCLYSIDARFRLTLEEFARTTVQPIYESRPRIRPEDAVADESESEFIREVTGQITVPTITVAKSSRLAPKVFVTALSVLVAILGTLAIIKFMSNGPAAPVAPPTAEVGVNTPVTDTSGTAPPSQGVSAGAASVTALPASATVEPATVTPAAPIAMAPPIPLVQVEVHPPSGAKLIIREQELTSPAYLNLPAGPNVALVNYNRGRSLRCPFDAVNNGIVRLVDDALHVSGAAGPKCSVAGE